MPTLRMRWGRLPIAFACLCLACGPADAPTRGGDGSIEARILEHSAQPDVWRGTIALSELLAGLDAEAVPALRGLLEAPPRDLGAVPSILIVTRWAQHAPEEAALWSLRAPTPHRRALVSAAVAEWARVEPTRVVKELGLGAGNRKDPDALVALVRGWFASGRPGLEDYVHDLGPSPDRQRALSSVLRERIQRDGAPATGAWVERVAPGYDERYQRELYRHAGSELALADPRAGVAWCERHCDGEDGGTIRQLVATRWAARDAQATFDWLESSDGVDPLDRSRALRAAFAAAMRSDRATALAWVESLDEEERRDAWRQPALSIFINARSLERPAEALAWTDYLQDPQVQEQARVAVARRWRERDEAAAEAWLAQSPLSEEAREQARSAGESPGAPAPARRGGVPRMLEPGGATPPPTEDP